MKNRKAEKLRNEFDKGFHEGFTLTDILKRQWRLGNLIGRGGFGNVYTVFPCDSSQVSEYKISDFSAKIEPHSNGPLFTEVAFYQRVATQEKISNWCSKKGLKFLGIPPYLSTGCDKTNKPHRFIILARLGLNVENIWQEMNKNFSTSTIYQIGYRLLECLEYIHQFGYSHGDIKTSNLMTGYNDDLTNCRIYLMDFGLACSFMNKSIHKQYKEDPKRRHDGTIEYTSLDAHNGVAVSRRGDLVNLGFVILHLLQGDLPWISLISDKEKVLFEKSIFLKNPALYLSNVGIESSPRLMGVLNFFDKIRNLNYENIPPYSELYEILSEAQQNYAVSKTTTIFLDGRVCFTTNVKSNISTARKRVNKLNTTLNPLNDHSNSPQIKRKNPTRVARKFK